MNYLPTPEDCTALGLALEQPRDPEKPHPAWLSGTRKYSHADEEGNRRVLEVCPQYDNLVWLYTTSAHQQSTSTCYRGVLPSQQFFHNLLSALGWPTP
jgi:hypothetical protein